MALTVSAVWDPPLFTRPFVLAALANSLLNLAAFLFVHFPGFLQQLGAGEAQIGRIMGAQALGAIVAWPMVGRSMDLRGRSTRHDQGHARARSVLVTAAQRNLVSVWLAAFAFFIGVAALFSFMKTFVGTTATGGVGSFFVAYATVAVALRVFAGWLPDRLGPQRLLGIAMFSYAAGLVVLSTARTSTAVAMAGLLCGAGHGYTFPVLFSLVVERARPQERGAAAAFFTTLDWLALLVAGPVVGYVIERTSYRLAFTALAGVLAIGIITFYSLDDRGMATSE